MDITISPIIFLLILVLIIIVLCIIKLFIDRKAKKNVKDNHVNYIKIIL